MMSVTEILEQVKALSLAERKEVAKAVIDLLDVPVQAQRYATGAEIVAILEAMEAPIELVDPEIEDPVEWVKAQRKKESDRLNPYWNGEA
jgi:hypothetical protein